MKDTYAAICPKCHGWVHIHCSEDPKERADVYKTAAKIGGPVRVVDSADIRSGAQPMCKCGDRQRPPKQEEMAV